MKTPIPKTPLRTLLTGQIRPLGERQAPSGIDKHPRDRPLRVGRTGLEGDAQGDLKHHGGLDKAVHHYALDHYPAWRSEIGPAALLDAPGAFGENLSTLGLREDMVAVGDIFRLGGATLQVSQGRAPCWKLNARFSVPDMAKRVQNTGRTGWYYRVIEEGVIAPGDTFELIDRRSPEWILSRVWSALYLNAFDHDALSGLAALPHLTPSWRNLAARRLASGTMEDHASRLEG